MTTELTTFDGLTSASQGLRNPVTILEEAKERATALLDVVRQTGASITLGKSEHLKIEAWITIGAFYNCTARVKEAEPVEIGSVIGFKAHALLVHDPSGQALSEADAYCMRDEEKWNTRPKYEWDEEQRKKVKIGEEEVPLFQLASMAQTRAMAKVLAAKFRWVVVLKGFSSTPAEEMTGNEQNHETPERKTYTLKPKAAVARPIPYGPAKGQLITEAETQHLKDFVTRKRDAIASGKVPKNFLANDTLLCDAIDAELASRKDSFPSTDSTDESNAMPEFTQEAWEAVILEWSAKHGPLLKQVKDQHKVKEVGKIPAKDRADFYALMQDAINAETS
jgi:hypothetical protein